MPDRWAAAALKSNTREPRLFQNIDRLVTLFKAARKNGRRLIIDFYTAEVLQQLRHYGRLPQADWPPIRVCYPYFLAQHFEKLGLNHILESHRRNGIKWTRIKELESKVVMLVKAGFIRELKKYLDLEGATWIYSMWPGYFERSKALRSLKSLLESRGVAYRYIHTSGHAKIVDLERLAEAMAPEIVIPIHSFAPDQYKMYFKNVVPVNDGHSISI